MKCKICESKYKDEINVRLENRKYTGESLRQIADDYFKFSYSTIQRHNQNCLNLEEDQEDLAEDEVKDVGLEDLRDKALEHYDYAIKSGNTKLADSALGHIIRVEELIARRYDRALAREKGDEVIEIELRWADEDTTESPTSIIPTSGLIPELPEAEEIPESIPPEFESPNVEYYKKLAEESKPVKIRRNEAGKITHIETPAGIIPKIPNPEVVDVDFEEYGTRIDSDGVRYDHFPSVGFGIDDFDDLPLLSTATPDIKDRRKRITGGN